MADVVLAAVPTPFAADGSLDLACARRLYEFLADRADGLLVAGTTGEFPALDEDERLVLIDTAIDVLGPDRIIAHIGAPDAYRAVRLAREASLLGASRIAAITPYYLAASPAEVTEYYLRIREAAPEPGLYAYIFPERTGLTVAPQQFCELADAVGLAGAKFSGVAARNVAECAAARPGLRIFSGDDTDLAATLRAGGAGIISARASAFPEVFSGLSAAIAAAAGDPDAAGRWRRGRPTSRRSPAWGRALGWSRRRSGSAASARWRRGWRWRNPTRRPRRGWRSSSRASRPTTDPHARL